MNGLLYGLLSLLVLAACNDTQDDTAPDSETNPPAPTILFQVINQYPHDTAAFTQGLAVQDGIIYESTGLNGSSWVGPVSLQTGKIDRKVDLSNEYFGDRVISNSVQYIGGRVSVLSFMHQ